MRVENVKGAVWTVDEVEFHKRRPQRSTSGYEHNNNKLVSLSLSLCKSFTSLLFFHRDPFLSILWYRRPSVWISFLFRGFSLSPNSLVAQNYLFYFTLQSLWMSSFLCSFLPKTVTVYIAFFLALTFLVYSLTHCSAWLNLKNLIGVGLPLVSLSITYLASLCFVKLLRVPGTCLMSTY